MVGYQGGDAGWPWRLPHTLGYEASERAHNPDFTEVADWGLAALADNHEFTGVERSTPARLTIRRSPRRRCLVAVGACCQDGGVIDVLVIGAGLAVAALPRPVQLETPVTRGYDLGGATHRPATISYRPQRCWSTMSSRRSRRYARIWRRCTNGTPPTGSC